MAEIDEWENVEHEGGEMCGGAMIGGEMLGGTMLGGCQGCPMCGGLVYLRKGTKLKEGSTQKLDVFKNNANRIKDENTKRSLNRIIKNIQSGRTYTVAKNKNPSSKNFNRLYWAIDKKSRTVKPRRKCTKDEFEKLQSRREQMAYARACKARKIDSKGYFTNDDYKTLLKAKPKRKSTGSKKAPGKPKKQTRSKKTPQTEFTEEEYNLMLKRLLEKKEK